MEFKTYNQKEIYKSEILTSFILNTTADNLSYIYGEEMRSDESRQTWIKYNLEQVDRSWRTIVGFKDEQPLGFIIYKINRSCLYICDIEIIKSARRKPSLLGGMLNQMLTSEKITSIAGYINKENIVSQNNFLKYATDVTESEKGFSFKIDEKSTKKIKERFKKHYTNH